MKALHKICLCLLLALAGLGVGGAEPKRVLFIHSFGRGFEPYHTFAGRLRTELASQLADPVDFFEASVQSARFIDPEQESPLLEYLQTEFARHPLDLVVPIGGPAAQFAQQHRQQLFPETPMLFAVDQRVYNRTNLTAKDTAALMANEAAPTVEMILQVLPETTNVVVVMGNSAHERFWSAEIRRELESFTNRVSFAWLDQLPFSEMLKRCAALPPRSAIYFPFLLVDAAGVPHLEEHAMLKLHEVANAPIFGLWVNQLGQGIVGGRLVDLEEYSRKAATAAARILHGESPGSIQLPPQRVGPPEFDWRELRRWGISEARLPPGSLVGFRQPGIWERYWGLICGGVLFAAVEAALLIGLLINRAKRRHGETMARLLADLSSRFINLPADKVDPEIDAAQRRICECLGFDISSLWQWSAYHPDDLVLTHVCRLVDGPPISERMSAQHYFPWCLQEVKARRRVAVASLEEAPAGAARDWEVFRHFGIKASLTIPLAAGEGPTLGAVSFNTVRAKRAWPEELVTRLELVAEIFANALARKRADQELRESEARLASAVEVAMLGFYEMASDPGQVFVDERLRSLLGVAPQDTHRVQEFWIEHIHPDDRERVRELSLKVLGGELQGVTVEYRYLHPERGTLWFSHVSRAEERDATGRTVRRLGVIRDITEQRQAELESQRLRGNLAHLTRVNTLGALSGSLAHELNQPLGIILSNAQAAQELLTQEPPDTTEVQAILADIVKADRRAGEVIERLRALFKGGQASLQKLSLNAVIEEVLRLTRAELLGRGVTVIRELAPNLPAVVGDRVQLQQLVLNLILNAADAMAANAPGTRRLHLRTMLHLDHVRASVRDEGEGLPADVERLFHPLYTTKPQGLGMGLAICRSIVGAHNGRLWAERHPERGAVFHFELPVAEKGKGRGNGNQ